MKKNGGSPLFFPHKQFAPGRIVIQESGGTDIYRLKASLLRGSLLLRHRGLPDEADHETDSGERDPAHTEGV